MHDMFAQGDEEIVVIDEWKSQQPVEKSFAGQADIPKTTEAAHVEGQPKVTYLTKVNMPDEY